MAWTPPIPAASDVLDWRQDIANRREGESQKGYWHQTRNYKNIFEILGADEHSKAITPEETEARQSHGILANLSHRHRSR